MEDALSNNSCEVCTFVSKHQHIIQDPHEGSCPVEYESANMVQIEKGQRDSLQQRCCPYGTQRKAGTTVVPVSMLVYKILLKPDEEDAAQKVTSLVL